MTHALRTLSAVLATVWVLASCGGGGGSSGATGPAVANDKPAAQDASRFLAQATMGSTEADINHLTQVGYAAWFDEQFAMAPAQTHRAYIDAITPTITAAGGTVSQSQFFESWWKQAITGPDQLRQRVAFALSQLFVVSFQDSNVAQYPRGVASYYDMLGAQGFGNFRDLLESVTLHPMMGLYLTSMKNTGETPSLCDNIATPCTRVPDQNYAREVMQLFTIGLYQLNGDGTLQTASGVPVETYNNNDIVGLSRVFTSFSWYPGPNLTDRTATRFYGGTPDPNRDITSMVDYAGYTSGTTFHSMSQKTFLGVTIAATPGVQNARGDLKIALDTLFNHPNLGPFVAKQLIQRLVTSNPSPAYVKRVADVFANNGAGVRGDMKSVIKAVLLDAEARTFDANNATFGKLREPVLRLSSFFRAFNASSASGRFLGIDNTDNTLAQTPMRAGSVFNFYRPGYVPAGTSLASANLVAPEMQITQEISVASYLNVMRNWVALPTPGTRDVAQDYSKELALADTPDQLVDRVNLLLTYGQLSAPLKAQIVAAVNSRAVPVPTKDASGNITNQAAIDSAHKDRVALAVYLALASPEYIAQR